MVLTYLLISIARLPAALHQMTLARSPLTGGKVTRRHGAFSRRIPLFSELTLLAFIAVPAQALDSTEQAPATHPDQSATTPVLLILGDSLSAAYGIPRKESWPALLLEKLQKRALQQQKPSPTIFNASISGETTSGGLRRLPELLLKHQPTSVIVELGANDGLRGQSLKAMRKNLLAIIHKSQQAGANVLLLGMYIPSNYGRAYVEKFHAIYGEVAQQTDSGVVDFMLEPIAFDESNFLDDRIHPNAAAQPTLLKHLWPAINALLTTQ